MQEVQMELTAIDSKIGRTVFRDKNNPNRWDLTKVPGLMGERGPDPFSQIEVLGFEQKSENKLDYTMKDFSTQEVLFDTSSRALVMTDKYLEIGIRIPSQIIFGLGQHNAKFLLSEGNWTMWNRDRNGSPIASGQGDTQSYGTHPFLMAKTTSNKFIGLFFYNSNAQEINIKHVSDGKSIITYKTTGGILDVYYFYAGSADEVITNYYNLIGKPSMPPFWGLGFQQSSWLYNNTKDLENVVKNYEDNDFPFDVIWADIPYMHNYINFSVNKTAFRYIKKFVDGLHKTNKHFVPIIDAGVSIEKAGDKANWYNIGRDMGIFIKSAKNPDKFDGNIIGSVWPKSAAFVDFFHPKSTDYWKQGLQHLHDIVPFDGVWLDMNEASNSCKDKDDNFIGECPPEVNSNFSDIVKKRLDATKPQLYSTPGAYDSVPWTPSGRPLYERTLSMDAYHYDESDSGNYIQYNTHSLFATLETRATAEFLKGPEGKKPFIISRASFAGHGQYGSVWTGDNRATQDDLKLSINQVMLFNIFGIPFTGGDI